MSICELSGIEKQPNANGTAIKLKSIRCFKTKMSPLTAASNPKIAEGMMPSAVSRKASLKNKVITTLAMLVLDFLTKVTDGTLVGVELVKEDS